MAQDFHFKLKKFLGLRAISDSDSALLPGESPSMVNFKISEGYGLKKREGYERMYTTEGRIRGAWAGKYMGEDFYCLVVDDCLLVSSTSVLELGVADGRVPGNGRVEIFPFHDGLYLLTGAGIRRFYDNAVQELTPHIPLVMISTTPSGSGVAFEEVNILTPHVRQYFSGTGTDEWYNPILANRVVGVDFVKVDGELLPMDQYCWDPGRKMVSFMNAPAKGIDNVEIQMEISQTDESHRIHNCRYALGFGGANDTRVFLYGNEETPAMRYHSGVVDGKPSFHYFPETGYTMVGTGAAITSILRHYDRQLIFTENAAYYSYLEYMTGENGKLIAAFPTLPLSDDRGCLPEGQALLVDNTPCTLDETGLYFWISTNIRDERNAQRISDPIARALREEIGENAILFNRKSTSELYLSFENRIYVYNYRIRRFYYYEIPYSRESPRGFFEMGTDTYFYTDQSVYHIGGEMDNEVSILARWSSGFLDFGEENVKKNLFKLSFLAETREDTDATVVLEGQNEEGITQRELVFPRGQDHSPGKLRLSLRRMNLVKIKLESWGRGPFSLKEIHIEGRKIDKQ